jgi:hypothetical protein
MSKYLNAFNKALRQYQKQKERPGYKPGLLSWIRHRNCTSSNPNLHIQGLKNHLIEHDDSTAEETIKLFLTSPKTQLNNHSFGTYLIDVLSKKYPDENWEDYYPNDKKLILYNGMVYRGMRISNIELHNFFNKGLTALKNSDKIDDYVCDTSMSLGVSTSKDDKVAEMYATSVISRGIRECGQMIFLSGYLLEIDYRGDGGIDLLPTLTKRGQYISSFLGSPKKEVNIVGRISPKDIKGAWFVDRKGRSKDFIKNEKYKEIRNRKPERNDSQPTKLRRLFNM